MNVSRRSIAWLIALALSIPLAAQTAQAQFEEPDTVGRLAVGPFVELYFWGDRGVTASGTKVSLTGGPAFGARLEYRLTRTFTLGAAASYVNPDEELESAGNVSIGEAVSQLQFTGEAHLRVKPDIPGYFILGGGVRIGDPGDAALHQESYNEPLGILGAGLQFIARRHWAGRVEFRANFVSPADQPNLDMEGLETDFSIGLGVMWRP